MKRDSVTYRLGTSGEQDVINTLGKIKEAGEASAKAMGSAYDRDLRVAETAVERLQRRAEQLKALGGSAIQRTINANTGINSAELGNTKSAEASMRAFVDAQMEASRASDRLLAQFDPLYAAQLRYNQAMSEATRLNRAGALSTDQLANVQQRAKAELDAVRVAQDRSAGASAAMGAGYQNLGFQVSDFAVQVGGGTSAVRAFALQGPQAIQALAMMGQGAQGAGGKFARFAAFLGGPWGAALTVGVSVAGALATKLLDTGDAAEVVVKSLDDVRLVSDGVSDAQSVLSGMFDMTTGALTGQNEVLRANIALMAAKLRAEAATARSIALDVAGDAGKSNLSPASIYMGTAFFSNNTVAKSKLQQVIAGKADPSEVIKWAEKADFSRLAVSQTEFINAVARAAEVASKRATAAAIDDSLASGRLDPDLRQPGTASARARGGGRDNAGERAAREAERANRELEQTLRSLTDAYDPLAAAEAKRADQLADILKLEQAGMLDPGRAEFFRDKNRDEYLNTVFAPEIEAGKEADEERAQERERQNQLIVDMLADQERAVQLQALDAQLIGASADERERELGHLGFILDLQRQGLPLEDDRVRALIRGNDALIAQGQAMADANRVLEEQRRIGENLIDTIFDPQNWDDWGELGKKVIQDLIREMLILAAINPLKNQLFGSGLPTLGGGGILGFLGGLFGGPKIGGGGGVGGAILNISSASGRASGTEWDPGGWRRVGEFGEELVRLPRGSQVVNAGRTRAMGQSGSARPLVIHNTIHADGADAAGLRRVEDAVDRLNASIERRAIAATIDANQRTFGAIWAG